MIFLCVFSTFSACRAWSLWRWDTALPLLQEAERSQISHCCRREVPWNPQQPFPGPATSWICKAPGQMKGADGMCLFNSSATSCLAHSWCGPCWQMGTPDTLLHSSASSCRDYISTSWRTKTNNLLLYYLHCSSWEDYKEIISASAQEKSRENWGDGRFLSKNSMCEEWCARVQFVQKRSIFFHWC